MSNSKKGAAGCGNIRKKTVIRGGKEYEYWEARYTVGFDPGTGKQVQKSVSGKTQKEVAQKLKAATAAFTLDVYGHVTEKMKKDSADRMQAFIKFIS